MYTNFTSSARDLIQTATQKARGLGQKYVKGPHVLGASLEMGMLETPLSVMEVNPKELSEWLNGVMEGASTRYNSNVSPKPDTYLADLLQSFELTKQVDEFVLLGTLLEEIPGFSALDIRNSPVAIEALRAQIYRGKSNSLNSLKDKPSGEPKAFPSNGHVNAKSPPKKPSGAKPYLRKPLVEKVASTLGRFTCSNPLVVGDSGVGKTALLESINHWLASDSKPQWIPYKSVQVIECGSFAAASAYQGQMEKRLDQVLNSAMNNPDLILFFDNFHMLAGTDHQKSSRIWGIFLPYLNQVNFRVIASTSPKRYEDTFRTADSLISRFDVIKLQEPTKEETVEILKSRVEGFKTHFKGDVTDDTLNLLVNSCEKYLAGRRFPAKAVTILDRAFQHKREIVEKDENREREWTITADDVLHVVSEESQIPVSQLSDQEQNQLGNLQKYLEERVIDQPKATRSMTSAIQTLRLGLKDPKRTKMSFMFVGPPGTGKTELAKAVAEYMTGNEHSLVRFNMSEFQTKESSQRLIGPPPGYVGYEEGGELTNKLLENPFSFVLFDEIEKASSRVFDLLLQVLSDGHLTDNHGTLVDCKNSVFILTSNAISDAEKLEEPRIRELLLQYTDPFGGEPGPKFRKEFIDRMEIIQFAPLSLNTLSKITQKEVERVIQQVREGDVFKANIELDGKVVQHLICEIDASVTGARSIQRLVDAEVARLISTQFINGLIDSEKEYLLTVVEEKIQLIGKD